MLNIGVLVSGGGTNLQAIIDKIENGTLHDVRIATVVSGKEGAYALERAKKHNIPAVVISKDDKKIIEHLKEHNVELVVLAGYMSMIGEEFVNTFKNRIINVHPALIPSFCGKGMYGIRPHQKVLEMGVKVTGATVHFVDFEYDNGPIILQKAVNVLEGDTAETLQRRVMEEAEWNILPEAIQLFADNRLTIDGRIVRIAEEKK